MKAFVTFEIQFDERIITKERVKEYYKKYDKVDGNHYLIFNKIRFVDDTKKVEN